MYDLFFSFEGRINRRQFWTAFGLLIALELLLVNIFSFSDLLSGYALLIPTAIPLCLFFAVIAKRYHDQDKRGWWGLIWFAPVVGWLYIIIECGFGKGSPMKNKYGPPLYGPLSDQASVNGT